MPLKITSLYKWLWTLITWKRFLTSVGSSVNFQITILWKWLWTLITWKMFLTNVGFSMNFKMAISWKWLLTLVTKKSFLITYNFILSMNRLCMCFKSSFPLCLVFTQITSVPHISMNRIQMSFKNSFPCCLVITLITSVPHISLNRFYMCFKNSFPVQQESISERDCRGTFACWTSSWGQQSSSLEESIADSLQRWGLLGI